MIYYSVSSATINGTQYTPKQVVCFDVDNESDKPLFGVIVDLLLTGHEELFILQQVNTLSWVRHLHAFQIQEVNNVIILKHEALVDYHHYIYVRSKAIFMFALSI